MKTKLFSVVALTTMLALLSACEKSSSNEPEQSGTSTVTGLLKAETVFSYLPYTQNQIVTFNGSNTNPKEYTVKDIQKSNKNGVITCSAKLIGHEWAHKDQDYYTINISLSCTNGTTLKVNYSYNVGATNIQAEESFEANANGQLDEILFLYSPQSNDIKAAILQKNIGLRQYAEDFIQKIQLALRDNI